MACLAISTWAEQITREEALRKAQYFLSQKGLPGSLTSADTKMSRNRAQGGIQPDYYYVFNAGQNQGFVIVSGDDRTETVLGYATSGHFDVDNIPQAMADLLNYYSYQIEAIQRGAYASIRRASHLQVQNLMTVKWNQEEPYNNKTPLGYYSNSNTGYHCVTGCVATAMAQVLYHQRFVNATQATIPGYQNYWYWPSPSGDMHATLEAVPSGTALEWNNMVDNYEQTTTPEQKEAVANLMLYCGTAVNMKYNLPEAGGSSASVSAIPDAFKKYFGYSRGTRYVQRNEYTDSEWDNLIYNEIASGRPVIYGGQTANDEGHAFIVHGYDGNGKYAINWGWGGYQDNYFTLDKLTPDDQGTGGGSGGYNYDQEAVVYLAKDDGTFSEVVKATVVEALVGDNNGGPNQTEYSANKNAWGGVESSLAFAFSSHLANTYTMAFGYGILNSSGQLVDDVNSFSPGEIKNGLQLTRGYKFTSFGMNLPVGSYLIKAYSKESTASEWLLCDDADKHAISLTVTDTRMSFKVVDLTSNPDPDPEPEVTDAQRNELKTMLDGLKKSITDKQNTVTANTKEINALQSVLTSFSETVNTISTKSASLKKLVNSNSLLSEAQKTEYQDAIANLEKMKEQLETKIEQISARLDQINKENESLKTQLSAALTSVNEQISAVSDITTTAALETANAEAAALQGQINGYNTDNVATAIQNTKNDVAALDSNSLSDQVTTLEETINKAIKDAEDAQKEQAEKLAKAKEECKQAVAALTEAINSQTKKYNEILKSLTKLNNQVKEVEGDIKALQAKAKELSDMIAQLKSSSTARHRASADDIANLENALEKLNKLIEKLEESKKKVEAEIKTIAQLSDNTKKMIDESVALRNEIQTGYAAATSIDDVEAMTTQVTAKTTVLNSESEGSVNDIIADINSEIAKIENEITEINIDVTKANNYAVELEQEVVEVTGISDITIDEKDIIGRYDMMGRRVDSTYKGVQMIRLKNGRIIKINVK